MERTRVIISPALYQWKVHISVDEYDLSHVGRDTVNTGISTFKKIAPSLCSLKTAANQADRAAEKKNTAGNNSMRKINWKRCTKNNKTGKWRTVQNTFFVC